MDELDTIARAAARGSSTVASVPAALARLCDLAPPWVALEKAAAAARAIGLPPRPAELRAAAMAAAAGDPIAATAYAVAVVRHRARRSNETEVLLASDAVMRCACATQSSNPTGLFLQELAHECATVAARWGSQVARTQARVTELHVACRRAEIGDPIARGRAVATVRALLARYDVDPDLSRGIERGVIEHNLARAILRGAVGDPDAALAEARHLFEAALTREDRREIAREAMTRGELAGVLRMIAEKQSGAEQVATLAIALAHARRAEELAPRVPPDVLEPADARRVRWRIELALAVARGDAAALEGLAREVRSYAHEGPLSPRDASLRRQIAVARRAPFPLDQFERDQVLAGLHSATRASGRLDASDAVLLADCLLATFPRTREHDVMLGQTAILADPQLVGLELYRTLRDAELVWISEHTDAELREAWADAVVRDVGQALDDPTRPVGERRVLGRWLAGVAWMRARETRDAVARLRWFDLAGASSFRADASFFGSGPIHGSAAADWRRALHRTRVALDLEAERLDGHLLPGDRGSPRTSEPMLEERDGGYQPVLRSPHDGVDEERRQLAARWAHGRTMAAAYPTELGVPKSDEIARWLAERPCVGVLLAVPESPHAARISVLRAEAGAVVEHDVDAPPIGIAALIDLATAFAPRRARGSDGRLVSLDEASELTVEEQMSLRPEPLGPDDIILADAALGRVLAWLAPIASQIARIAEGARLTSLRVLSRGPLALLPWEAAPLTSDESGETLGERVALVHVATLASLPVRRCSPGRGILGIACTRAGSGTLVERVAASVLGGASQVIASPFTIDALEEHMAGTGVVRIVAHGAHVAWSPGQSGIELDDAPDCLGRPEHRYQACAARGADLRGVGRVEVWSCEGAAGLDLRGIARGEDEPAGFAWSPLLAGAGRVIAASWVQPAVMTELIGAAFARAPETIDAEGDARRLARAVREARERLERGGGGTELLGPVPRGSGAPASVARELLRRPWAWAGWRVTARDRDR